MSQPGRTPGPRGLLLGLIAVALLALLAQTYLALDRWWPQMASQVSSPSFAPALQPRITASSFDRIEGDVYRLQVSLQAAEHSVPMPALELTLTDAADQVLARRVLSPDMLGLKDVMLKPGAEQHIEQGVRLPASLQVAGYRLLAFYP